MLYRMRVYQAVRENLPAFHDFFRTRLLPVQLRHGARLVGRWQTEDGRVVAIWEYDDRTSYERIDAAVRADPDARHAQEYRAQLPQLMTTTEEVFMTSTIDPAFGQRSPCRRPASGALTGCGAVPRQRRITIREPPGRAAQRGAAGVPGARGLPAGAIAAG